MVNRAKNGTKTRWVHMEFRESEGWEKEWWVRERRKESDGAGGDWMKKVRKKTAWGGGGGGGETARGLSQRSGLDWPWQPAWSPLSLWVCLFHLPSPLLTSNLRYHGLSLEQQNCPSFAVFPFLSFPYFPSPFSLFFPSLIPFNISGAVRTTLNDQGGFND